MIEEDSATINSHKMQIKQVTPNPRDPEQGGGGGMRGGRGGMGRGGYESNPRVNQGGGYGVVGEGTKDIEEVNGEDREGMGVDKVEDLMVVNGW